MRTAIVVGAGIAGLATATGLANSGWKVELLEAESELQALGTGFALTENGMRALELLGLADEVRAVGAEHQMQGVRTAQGSQLNGASESFPIVGVHRATLHSILADAARTAGVTITTNARAERVEDGELVVDGERKRAELVVAADGIDSVIRNSLWPKVPTDYSGASCWRGVVPATAATPNGPVIWYGKGAEAGLVPLDGDRVYWYIAAMTRMNGSEPDEHAKAVELVSGYEQVLRDHVAAVPEGGVLRHDLMYLPTALRDYTSGNILLAGDAAHAMLPTLGQGASVALEDAATLAILGRRDDVQSMLYEYDLTRRPRTQRLQRLAYRAFRSGVELSHPLGLAVRNAALNLVPTLATEVAADWMLHWTPPED